jgi:hypothetical protein
MKRHERVLHGLVLAVFCGLLGTMAAPAGVEAALEGPVEITDDGGLVGIVDDGDTVNITGDIVGGSVDVEETTTDELTVTGTATIADLQTDGDVSVGGDLSVDGETATNGITNNGELTNNGDLQVNSGDSSLAVTDDAVTATAEVVDISTGTDDNASISLQDGEVTVGVLNSDTGATNGLQVDTEAASLVAGGNSMTASAVDGIQASGNGATLNLNGTDAALLNSSGHGVSVGADATVISGGSGGGGTTQVLDNNGVTFFNNSGGATFGVDNNGNATFGNEDMAGSAGFSDGNGGYGVTIDGGTGTVTAKNVNADTVTAGSVSAGSVSAGRVSAGTLAVRGDATVNGGLRVNGETRVNNLRVNGNRTVDMGGNPIQNVGAGSLPTDAATMGQLRQVESDLQDQIDGTGAVAAALASIGQPLEAGRTTIGLGIGGQGSQGALAVGVSHIFESYPNMVIKATLGFSTGNTTTGGVGFNYSF